MMPRGFMKPARAGRHDEGREIATWIAEAALGESGGHLGGNGGATLSGPGATESVVPRKTTSPVLAGWGSEPPRCRVKERPHLRAGGGR